MYRQFKMNETEGNVNVLIIAGVHGNEIGTIKLAYDLINTIADNDMTYNHINTLTILPCANLSGTRLNTRNQNYDPSDLNRCWDWDQSCIRSTINDLIDKSDIVIDLHCSELCDSMFFLDAEMNHITSILNVLKEYHIHYCVQSTYNDTIKRLADSKGKIGLTWEQCGLNEVDYDVNSKSLNTLLLLLDQVHKMKIESDHKEDPAVAYQLCNNYEGLYVPYIPVGREVATGDTIGMITDLRTNKVREAIYATTPGVLITQTKSKYVTSWNNIAIVQPM